MTESASKRNSGQAHRRPPTDSWRPTAWIDRRSGPAVLAVALTLTLALAPAHSSPADWPQFLGPNRNGAIPGANLATNWPKEGPPVLWQRKVGEGFSAPVVSRGKVLVFHRQSGKEILEAMDAASGRTAWKTDYPTSYHDDFGFDEGPRATPTVVGNRVYTYGADGMLSAFTLEAGTERWHVDTQRDFDSPKGFFGRACSPLVEGDAVIVNVGGRNQAGIVAFDRASGQVLWQVSTDEASYASPVAANFAGRRRVLVLTRSHLTALDPEKGRVLFQYPWRPPMQASVSAATPLVIDDLIFLSASYGTGATLLRYREKGPEKIWAATDGLSNHYATSVHHHGFLYGFDGRQEEGCTLRCIELKTGQSQWNEGGLKAGTVTLVGDQLLVLTERGELILAPATPSGFHPSARAQVLPFVVRAYPALADGKLYARSKDQLFCLDLTPRP